MLRHSNKERAETLTGDHTRNVLRHSLGTTQGTCWDTHRGPLKEHSETLTGVNSHILSSVASNQKRIKIKMGLSIMV